jgi:hypothetical protein
MAHFQKTAGDKNTRLDTVDKTLVLMLDERVKVDLWGGGPGGAELVVDVDDTNLVGVSPKPLASQGALWTYQLQGLMPGNTVLHARLFNQTPSNESARRQMWRQMPTWARLDVCVMGAEYKQGGGSWGKLAYGSSNRAWAHVKWTNMAQAGCGPTSLAIVMDYLNRLYSLGTATPACYLGTDPKETMSYTSTHGRAADANGNPSGTSGPIMIANIAAYYPDYQGRSVSSLKDAARILRAGSPIIFLAKNTTTYKYDRDGNKITHTWPGHFMVLLGVEHDEKVFWISDPSRAAHKYITSEELKKTQMWWVYRR